MEKRLDNLEVKIILGMDDLIQEFKQALIVLCRRARVKGRGTRKIRDKNDIKCQKDRFKKKKKAS